MSTTDTWSVDDNAKLKSAMLFVAQRLSELGERWRGAVKLNKILWSADFEHYRKYGTSITGAEYQRLPEGPAPVRLRPARDALVNSGRARLDQVDVGLERPQTILVAVDTEDFDFTDEERRSLDEAIERFRDKTGTQCSEMSHAESAGWQAVQNQEVIPYETAVIETGEVRFTDADLQRVRDTVQAHLTAEQ